MTTSDDSIKYSPHRIESSAAQDYSPEDRETMRRDFERSIYEFNPPGDVGPESAPQVETPSKHCRQASETDTHLLCAYTPGLYAGHYPWYFNLTMIRMQGDVILTVRLPTVYGAGPGDTSSVRFTRDMWEEFYKNVERANKVFEATDYLDSIL